MQKNIYHITPNRDFLKELATFVLGSVNGDLFRLAGVKLFLPNKRSVMKIKEYFVEASANRAIILPQIFSLSDISLEEFEFESEFKKEIENIKPSIRKEERLFLLSRIIRESAESYNLGNITFEAALKLAVSLCGIMDEMHKYEIPAEKLEDILPDDLSEYRQISLGFLKFALNEYKKELEKKNKLDFSERNIAVIDLYSQILTERDSNELVVIAGSTGTHPSVSRLIATIMKMPLGRVFLPYVDVSSSEREWAEIEKENNEINHQKHLHSLLKFLELKRSEIQLIGGVDERAKLVSAMMKCGSDIASWKDVDVSIGLGWLRVIEAQSEIREVKIIAAIAREGVELGKTVGVVTNNMELGRNVKLFLERFGVRCLDSAGLPLDKTTEGKFLLQVAGLIASDFNIISLLAFLKDDGFDRLARKNNFKKLRDFPDDKMPFLRNIE